MAETRGKSMGSRFIIATLSIYHMRANVGKIPLSPLRKMSQSFTKSKRTKWKLNLYVMLRLLVRSLPKAATGNSSPGSPLPQTIASY